MRSLLLTLWLVACGGPVDTADTYDTATSEPPTCGDGACVDADGESVETCPWDCGFRYVVLVDLQTTSDGEAPGVDLAAMALHQGEVTTWLTEIVASEIRGVDNAHVDPSVALGPAPETCEEVAFVSVGGRGAYLVGAFGADRPIRVGDRLAVYEVSDRMCEDGSRNDRWELLLANAPDPLAGEWIGSGSGLAEVEVLPW